MHLLWCILLLLGVTVGAVEDGGLSASALFADPVLVGNVSDERVPESSGMVCSHANPGLMWTVNDSSNKPRIHGLKINGEYLLQIKSEQLHNIDWEDLCRFTYLGKSYVMVADVGDNNAIRPFCLLYVFEEPVVNAQKEISVELAWYFAFTYPDGARDCEAVAVDEREQRLYLISKRDIPARIYSLPVKPTHPLQEAVVVGALLQLPQPQIEDQQQDKEFGKYRSQVTSLAIDTDRGIAAVNTYKHIYIYEKGELTWGEAFARQPTFIARPTLLQAESVCFDAEGHLYFGSEQLPWPLMQCRRLP